MKLLDVFRKKKSTITTKEASINTERVDIYDKDGNKIDEKMLGDKEKRMAQLLDIISKAGQTERYLVCVTIHDPENKLKIEGGNLHHYVFQQDFPQEDRYGCLDKYSDQLGLGDK